MPIAFFRVSRVRGITRLTLKKLLPGAVCPVSRYAHRRVGLAPPGAARTRGYDRTATSCEVAVVLASSLRAAG